MNYRKRKPKRIPDKLLAALSEYVSSQLGLHFPPARWRDLERGAQEAAERHRFTDGETLVKKVISSPDIKRYLNIIAAHLTVGETYFMREKAVITALRNHILPELLRNRQGKHQYLRIWSAGCSTGEEPYSIAILLHEMIPDLHNWNISILATDVNPHALSKASGGVYSRWSFRHTPTWVQKKYFRQLDSKRYEILPEIKQMVEFANLNLADLKFPSVTNYTHSLDIILCRNVLMYFTQKSRTRILENFHECLTERGWLILSATEIFPELSQRFTPVSFPGAVLYRKLSRPALPSQERKGEPFVPGFPEAPRGRDAGQNSSKPDLPKSAKGKTPRLTKVRPTTDSQYDRALSHYEAGHYGETIAILQKKLENDSGKSEHEVDAMLLLARAHANSGNLSAALQWCEKAIAANKLNYRAYYLLGAILQEQREFARAEAALKQALFLEPGFTMSHFVLGNIMRFTGRTREAQRYFQTVLSLLNALPEDTEVADSDGMSAGRLEAITHSMLREIKSDNTSPVNEP